MKVSLDLSLDQLLEDYSLRAELLSAGWHPPIDKHSCSHGSVFYSLFDGKTRCEICRELVKVELLDE